MPFAFGKAVTKASPFGYFRNAFPISSFWNSLVWDEASQPMALALFDTMNPTSDSTEHQGALIRKVASVAPESTSQNKLVMQQKHLRIMCFSTIRVVEVASPDSGTSEDAGQGDANMQRHEVAMGASAATHVIAGIARELFHFMHQPAFALVVPPEQKALAMEAMQRFKFLGHPVTVDLLPASLNAPLIGQPENIPFSDDDRPKKQRRVRGTPNAYCSSENTLQRAAEAAEAAASDANPGEDLGEEEGEELADSDDEVAFQTLSLLWGENTKDKDEDIWNRDVRKQISVAFGPSRLPNPTDLTSESKAYNLMVCIDKLGSSALKRAGTPVDHKDALKGVRVPDYFQARSNRQANTPFPVLNFPAFALDKPLPEKLIAFFDAAGNGAIINTLYTCIAKNLYGLSYRNVNTFFGAMAFRHNLAIREAGGNDTEEGSEEEQRVGEEAEAAGSSGSGRKRVHFQRHSHRHSHHEEEEAEGVDVEEEEHSKEASRKRTAHHHRLSHQEPGVAAIVLDGTPVPDPSVQPPQKAQKRTNSSRSVKDLFKPPAEWANQVELLHNMGCGTAVPEPNKPMQFGTEWQFVQQYLAILERMSRKGYLVPSLWKAPAPTDNPDQEQSAGGTTPSPSTNGLGVSGWGVQTASPSTNPAAPVAAEAVHEPEKDAPVPEPNSALPEQPAEAVHEPEKDAPVPERNSAEPEQPAEEQTTEPQAQAQRTEAEAEAEAQAQETPISSPEDPDPEELTMESMNMLHQVIMTIGQEVGKNFMQLKQSLELALKDRPLLGEQIEEQFGILTTWNENTASTLQKIQTEMANSTDLGNLKKQLQMLLKSREVKQQLQAQIEAFAGKRLDNLEALVGSRKEREAEKTAMSKTSIKATQNAAAVVDLKKELIQLKAKVEDLTAKSNKQPVAASSSAASGSEYKQGFEAGVANEREALKKHLRFIERNLLVAGPEQTLSSDTLRTVCYALSGHWTDDDVNDALPKTSKAIKDLMD